MHKTKNKTQKHHYHITADDFMPKDEASIKLLRERAEKLALKNINKEDQINLVSYIRFSLGKSERYGIPYTSAKEVMHNVSLTPLPQTPSFVAGVINRRGMLVTVLDLKKFLNIKEAEENLASYIIIVESKGIVTGILADNIEGSDAFDPHRIEPPLAVNTSTNTDYISGLHQGSVAILNIDQIVTKVNAELNNSATSQ